ncbi:Hypothetical protein NTJ_06564 [Nesidiocoris tenuis]|uniref:Regulatory protein zeste n=1 Tax=Nesidiocoris tenuis TaxID=355587 RepID=A0ABN7AQM8_9HEMI|nr:Hypothetical protein NTJ_06564 [Nesidiocoris tenuis]
MATPVHKCRRDRIFSHFKKCLVEKRWGVLENERTDAQRKTRCWQSLAVKFNESSPSQCREWQKLRKLWENLKKRAKAAILANDKVGEKTGD